MSLRLPPILPPHSVSTEMRKRALETVILGPKASPLPIAPIELPPLELIPGEPPARVSISRLADPTAPFAARATASDRWVVGIEYDELAAQDREALVRPGRMQRMSLKQLAQAQAMVLQRHGVALCSLLYEALVGAPAPPQPPASAGRDALSAQRSVLFALVVPSRRDEREEAAGSCSEGEEEDEGPPRAPAAQPPPKKARQRNRHSFPLCLLPLLVAHGPLYLRSYSPDYYRLLALRISDLQRRACEAMRAAWPSKPLCAALEYSTREAMKDLNIGQAAPPPPAPPTPLRPLLPRVPEDDRVCGRDQILSCLGMCLSKGTLTAVIKCSRVDASAMRDLRVVQESCPGLDIRFDIG